MNAFDIAVRIAPIVASVLTLFGLSVAYLAWRSKLNLDKRSASTSYSLTRNKEYFEARNGVEQKFHTAFRDQSAVPLDELKQAIANDANTGRDVRFVLAHWEVMAASIHHGVLDEKMCFEIVGTTLVNTVDVLRSWIDDVRRNPAHLRRYDYLLILHDQWKGRLKKAKARGVYSRFEQYLKNKKSGRPFRLTTDYAEDQWPR